MSKIVYNPLKDIADHITYKLSRYGLKLIPWAIVMAHCPSSIRASVSASTISLNSFFSYTTWQNVLQFCKDVPCIKVYQSCSKN